MSRSWEKVLRLLPYLRRYWVGELFVFILMLIGTLLSQIPPFLMKALIDDALLQKDVHLLFLIVITMFAMNVAGSGLSLWQTYIYSRVSERILFDIQLDLFQHIQRLPLSFFQRMKVGDVMSRVGGDVNQIQGVLSGAVLNFVSSIITLIGITGFLLWLNTWLFLICLGAVPFAALTVRYFRPKIRALVKLSRERAADVSSLLNETFNGMTLVKTCVGEKTQAKKILKLNGDLMRISIKGRVISSLSGTTSSFIMTTTSLMVLSVGGSMIIAGTMTVGGLMVFYSFLGRFFAPFSSLAGLYLQIMSAGPSLDRIFELFDMEPEKQDYTEGVTLPNLSGTIEFQHVTFAYEPSRPIFTDLSFSIPSGQRVAIVGPSGVGKTTLIHLLLGFYEPTSGCIRLDGHDLHSLKTPWLRRQIGVVSQEPVIFHTSAFENLRYGNRKATMEQVIQAAQAAHIHDVICSLPNGYHTILGERGMRLSVGQKQRLAIAQALIKNPKILILDEATAAVDSESEGMIQEALIPLMEGRTNDHHLSSSLQCDPGRSGDPLG